MEKFTPEYSLKNIPYPTLHSFTLSLTEKIVDFIRRMRWKAHFYLNPMDPPANKGNYFNLKSQKTPPRNKFLEPFEEDLLNLIRIIKFRKQSNSFQHNIKNDSRSIKNSRKIWVRADKTRNIYLINPSEYIRILQDKVTNNYKLDHEDSISQINRDTNTFASKLKINDKMGKLEEKCAYVLFKDHKPNFLDKLQSRLINPSKTELGLVSKNLINEIVSNILNKSSYNLWKSSSETIEWFKNIKNKSKCTFIQFDIIDFYPSISKELLLNSLTHAKTFCDISDEQIQLILACRKSVLNLHNSTWIKNNLDNFDVSMGAYDSSQIADLIGIYILDTLSRIIELKYIGIYRDDGLIYIPDSNGPKTSNIEKKIIRAFRFLGFKIEIVSNLNIVNFLDISFNLPNNSYKPFCKDNLNPCYINVHSDHPKSIIKQIPNAINIRISRLCSNKHIFDANSRKYEEALGKSGFQKKLIYHDKPIASEPDSIANNITNSNNSINGNNGSNYRRGNEKSKNRKRKILWFNPPFCNLSTIEIGRYFLKLIDKHFNNNNPLNKIFNRKTIKISYSCTNNISKIITNHNKKLINESLVSTQNIDRVNCNCRIKDECPVNGFCNSEKVVYKATISTLENKTEVKAYIGISAGKWKQRFYNHKHSFSNYKIRNQTALSSHYWDLKDRGLTPIIKWEFIKTSSTPNGFKGRCNLCLDEKICILKYRPPSQLLNKRNELIFKCRHRNRFKLG